MPDTLPLPLEIWYDPRERPMLITS